MVITELVGNRSDPEIAAMLDGAHVERVTLPGEALVKRTQRVVTDHGNELGLRLPRGAADLKDGDVLYIDRSGERANAIVVETLPTDVLVIAPRSIREMGFVAHSLGNRHLPAQFFDSDSDYGAEVMVVQFDHTVEDFLSQHQVPYSRQERVMAVPFRHAEHTH